MKRLLLLLFVALVGALAGAAVTLSRPYKGFAEPVTVEIPRGIPTTDIARKLAAAGVLEFEWQFLAARAIRFRSKLQAGEYLFTNAASVWEVFDRISRGDVFFYEVLVPEGSNIFDIAKAAAKLPFFDEKKVLDALTNSELVRDIAPQAETLEGYLFPSTYRVTRSTRPEQLAGMMVEQFRAFWQQLRTTQPVHEVITLASLIEKETSLPRERNIVASVYLNRLRIGMKLDCDPTTIYAALLEQRYRGTIHQSDLDSRNRYNTYQNPGLPPGPIANPGLASIRAALEPAQTSFLYFVASPGGGGAHQFSESISQHHRAVAQYRRGNRQTKQKSKTGSSARGKKSRRG